MALWDGAQWSSRDDDRVRGRRADKAPGKVEVPPLGSVVRIPFDELETLQRMHALHSRKAERRREIKERRAADKAAREASL